ncbi:MAG TPA: hypothetical protein VG891_07015 [Rhizomicrobium sp.]|nr:hypothetical protein [Rhizomicrobium sp.]
MVLKLHSDPRIPVEFRPAWRLKDAAIERDTIAFWQKEGLIPANATPEARLGELCMAGYDESGRLIAVGTAKIRHIDFLGCKLAMFRCAVARDKRRNLLASVITAHSRELLEQWSLAHPEEEVMGMGTVVQSRAIDELARRAMFRASRLGFVGWTPQGEQMRVAWFEHGRIPAVQPESAMGRFF